MSPYEYMHPRVLPAEEWTEHVAESVSTRRDVKACWFVTTRYLETEFDVESLQEELHVELEQPPGDGGAPKELFLELAGLIGSTQWRGGWCTFSIVPASKLPALHNAGVCLWRREP